ncbi:MAG TPA: methionine synthase, partial [Dehalococcoidia bacterium]
MKHSTDRILTTHTGSLARPAYLLDLMKVKESGGPYDRSQYDAAVLQAVREVVRRQAECGIDVVNDGEQSKTGFANYIRDRLGGFEPVKDAARVGPPRSGGREEQLFPEYYEQYYKIGYFTTRVAVQYPMVCTGPITYKPEAIRRDLDNLKAALSEVPVEEVFVPATTPNLNQRNEYYKTQDEFAYAVADAIAQEYRAIVDEGFLLQIDAPGLPRPSASAPSPEEARRQVERRIEVLNYAVRDIPEEKVRFHTCFGVNMGP